MFESKLPSLACELWLPPIFNEYDAKYALTVKPYITKRYKIFRSSDKHFELDNFAAGGTISKWWCMYMIK